MRRTTRYFSVSVWVLLGAIFLTTRAVNAQNLGGIVAVETEPTISAGADKEIETFPSASLIPSDPTNDVSIQDPIEASEYQPESSSYTLGKEDIIEISVMRHPEVSGQYIINSEGKIQYEFIGDIKIEGMKKDEVKAFLTEELSEFIITPDVTVKIIGYNSKIVYVIGEVRNPGKIFMRGDTITVREALVQAGLPLLTGKVAQSRLITPSDDGEPDKKTIDVHKLLYEGDLRENLVMSPGDTLYVPPTFMAKALRVIQPVTAPISSAGSAGRSVTGY